ncbi:unnamed protein product, partial [Closterium sp. Naga37s-1]
HPVLSQLLLEEHQRDGLPVRHGRHGAHPLIHPHARARRQRRWRQARLARLAALLQLHDDDAAVRRLVRVRVLHVAHVRLLLLQLPPRIHLHVRLLLNPPTSSSDTSSHTNVPPCPHYYGLHPSRLSLPPPPSPPLTHPSRLPFSPTYPFTSPLSLSLPPFSPLPPLFR